MMISIAFCLQVTEAEHKSPENTEEKPSTLETLPRTKPARANCELATHSLQRGTCSAPEITGTIKLHNYSVPRDFVSHSSTLNKTANTLCKKRRCRSFPAKIGPPTCARKRGKQVTFHPSTKTWDGKCNANKYLQRLAKDFFNGGQRLDLLGELLQHGKLEDLSVLATNVANLIKRADYRRETITPLLEGTGSLALTSDHIPGLRYLLKSTKLIRDVCKRNQHRNKLFVTATPNRSNKV